MDYIHTHIHTFVDDVILYEFFDILEFIIMAWT